MTLRSRSNKGFEKKKSIPINSSKNILRYFLLVQKSKDIEKTYLMDSLVGGVRICFKCHLRGI